MWRMTSYLVITAGLILLAGSWVDGEDMEYRDLTPEEEYVIVHGGTESPFTGEYVDTFEDGVYVCRRCGAPLFMSETKFSAHCGWPAFDLAIEGAVEARPDRDGARTEILCASCGGHLGHVFTGEGFTERDTRHCVNSVSMDFIPADRIGTVFFAGGCFWGVENAFERTSGVLEARSGYMGGTTDDPSYSEVCSGATGHTETVKVVYDTSAIEFRELAMIFFEIHDPTQLNRQGVDMGSQYRSAVFYTTDEQLTILEELVGILRNRGYEVVTELTPAGDFWSAEEYHQNYFDKNGIGTSCHLRVRRFPEN